MVKVPKDWSWSKRIWVAKGWCCPARTEPEQGHLFAHPWDPFCFYCNVRRPW